MGAQCSQHPPPPSSPSWQPRAKELEGRQGFIWCPEPFPDCQRRKPGFKGVNIRCFKSSTYCNSYCFVAEIISLFLIAGIWVSGFDVQIYANKMQLSFREENGKMFYLRNKGKEEKALAHLSFNWKSRTWHFSLI